MAKYEPPPPGFVRDHRGVEHPLPKLRPTKDEAACCQARRDSLGRLPIGYCSDGCERRPPSKRGPR